MDIEKIRRETPIKELANFGIINLDKPSGPTSRYVDVMIKEALNKTGLIVSKASHFGTLDPMVTGVLPVALGRACRLLEWFMHKDKTYVGVMKVHEKINEKVLRETIKGFIGVIEQLPPIRSNVKRRMRKREIKSFEIIEINHETNEALFLTRVEAGTYIRKLCHDIGLKKGIGGAHMTELRRVEAGMFNEEKIVTMYEFMEAIKEYEEGREEKLRSIITPAEVITKIMPSVEAKNDKSIIKQLLTGKPLNLERIKQKKLPTEKYFSVFYYDNKEIFLGVYERKNDKEARVKFVKN
ncbi:RNA-guided pseudouridylation complex pseudouridine synthase subunit Cbf5 [Candidatus Pacearchaeota archaeon CG10_big_fil_rev_8_21_14_0_10_35_13]|nr:MAG: RNA-guided pseudouridylation complex pseudouridine synthase subunit Cbf5 [Candidatus Pacearchaeota archaeon CG10_big_fil_rev_8_21_14_0_10_35_13]